MSAKKHVYIFIVLALLSAGLLAACMAQQPAVSEPAGEEMEQAAEEEAAPEEDRPVVEPDAPAEAVGLEDEIVATQQWQIGYVIKNTINPYYVRMTAGAEEAGEDFNINVTVLAPQKPDNVEEQIRIMEDLIQQQVDGIVIAPTDTNGLAPVVEKAVEAGIPVIAIGTPVNTDEIVTFTGFDNITAGRMMGEWVVDQLDGSGKVVILEGPLGQQNAEDRRNGFLQGLESGEIEVLDMQTAQWQRAEALRVTEDWLQRFPEIDAIVASNDEMALGASEAVAAAGREGIVITGFDANNDALIAIQEGRMHATIDQVPDQQARQAVQLMVQHLENGTTFPPKLPWQDITMVTQENIEAFITGALDDSTEEPMGEEAPIVPTEAPEASAGVDEEIVATQQWQIGYVIKNTINPYYVRMTAGAEEAGEDFNVNVTVLAPQKPDNVEEQIRIMEDLIQQQVDGIVIAPTDTNGLAPVVERAVEAGIPVIAIGTPVNTDEIVTFTGFDNITAGRMMGEWVVDQLGGSGKVVILEGPLGQQNAEDRRNGFLQGLESGEIEVLDMQTAQWQRAEALRVTEDWLQRFPEIDAIVASNDEMALGASEAVAAAGREGIIITGFDANNDALIAIQEGRMHATIDQVPDKQARQAVQLMVQHLENGATFPPKLPWQDITMVTQENIDEFLK